jgi:hypothetical protein
MNLAQRSYRREQWSEKLPSQLDSKDTLVIAYFSPSLAKSRLWDELKEALPQSIIMGCSGAGEINQIELLDEAATLTIVKLNRSHIHQGSVTDLKGKSSEQIGEELAQQFPLENLKALYVLSDGLQVNGTGFIKGIRRTIGEERIISGGLAGDGTRFEKTSVLIQGKPHFGAVSAVGFYGDAIHISSSAEGGWRPFGPTRVITHSESNILYELDHKPALALYKEFLGQQSEKLPASALLFPLHLSLGPEHKNRDIVRTILSINEEDQSMTFAGDVPKGTTVQLMRASHESLIGAARDVSVKLASTLRPHLPTLSLIVSCVGRRLVLGENTEAEIETVAENLPKSTVQTGFYSYGEIAPGKSGKCDLHNQTITVTLIQEEE